MSIDRSRLRVLAAAIVLLLPVGSPPRRAGADPPPRVLHETYLFAQDRFHAGTAAAMRVAVRGSTSFADSFPLAGADVVVDGHEEGEPARTLWIGKTDAAGLADVRFQVPTTAADEFTLRVRTRSPYGEDRMSRTARIVRETRILLVTDKPLYQPAQVIHLRALALREGNFVPEARRPLRFEVQDPKGNRVFQSVLETSEHGVAFGDFALADEVTLGDYRVTASLDAAKAEKTVAVQRYALPRFKAEIKTDKRFYRPGEIVHGDVQADTFFGKPVAGGEATLEASACDGKVANFADLHFTLDSGGHASYELPLPDRSGSAIRLDLSIRDRTDHVERVSRTLPVSTGELGLALVPESGRLVPDMQNRVYVVATYPDGAPARCSATMGVSDGASDDPGNAAATARTGENGIGVFLFTPKASELQPAYGDDLLNPFRGFRVQPGTAEPLAALAVIVTARDDRGARARVALQLPSEAPGANLLLRLDRTIYRVGDTMSIAAFAGGAGAGTLYLDVGRGGQTIFTTTASLADGKAHADLPLSRELAGSIEIHGYYLTKSAEIASDAKVAYVEPEESLRIDIGCDREEYRPGTDGRIRFAVRDAEGRPTVAALGVIAVDESVYAVHEMQPGMEQAFFTLARELQTARLDIPYAAGSLTDLVRAPRLDDGRQEIAGVLLACAGPETRFPWTANPRGRRLRELHEQLDRLASALDRFVSTGHACAALNPVTGKAGFADDLLERMQADPELGVQSQDLLDPWGRRLTPAELGRLDERFDLAYWKELYPLANLERLLFAFVDYGRRHRVLEPDGGGGFRYVAGVLEAVSANAVGPDRVGMLEDPNGRPWTMDRLQSDLAAFSPASMAGAIRQVRLADAMRRVKEEIDRHGLGKVTYLDRRTRERRWSRRPLAEIFSDWPADWASVFPEDLAPPSLDGLAQRYEAFDLERVLRHDAEPLAVAEPDPDVHEELLKWRGQRFPNRVDPRFRTNYSFLNPSKGFSQDFPQYRRDFEIEIAQQAAIAEPVLAFPGIRLDSGSATVAAAPAPPRIREYFPETLLWQPLLVTDENGRAELPIRFADSITSWRLSASASTTGGLLGSADRALRVFQDFFVDLDLPVALTQGDELVVPVAVHNYLKEPQTVRLALDSGEPAGFEFMTDPHAELSLAAGEVTSSRFRIRALRSGRRTLTVTAWGTRMNDAVRRGIEVLPNGKRVESVDSRRLSQGLQTTVEIPAQAVDDTAKIQIKVYAGILSQVLEGVEGMLEMPHG